MSDYFVHESSYVDDNVTIGKNTKIWHFCHVQSGAVIGENCSFGQNVNISSNVTIMPNHGATLPLFWRNDWVGMSLPNVVCWRENATM